MAEALETGYVEDAEAWAAHPTPRFVSVRSLLRSRGAVVSLIVLAALLVIAVGAELLPYSAIEQDLTRRNQPPSIDHLLGTDHLGRDVLARLAFGARISLLVGVIASIITVVLGVLVGGTAGYVGGRVETVIMRGVDALYTFPDLLFAIFISALIKGQTSASEPGFLSLLGTIDRSLGGLLAVLIAIAVGGWLTTARLVRAEVLVLKRTEFVEASRLAGASGRFILLRHLLPNALPPVIVAATLAVPNAILLEAAMSFIGVGVNPPTPSWGLMLSEGLASLRAFPHLLLAPSITIGITLLSLNVLGDALRDALDPRLARQAGRA